MVLLHTYQEFVSLDKCSYDDQDKTDNLDNA